MSMRQVRGVLLLAAAAPAGSTVQAAVPEYALKAQILVELMSYVQWPPEAGRGERPFQIAVLGRSPFGPFLDAYAAPRTIHRRPIRLRYVARISEAEGCEALFICRTEAPQANAILAWAKARRILTLSDDEDLARRGAMVNLIMEDRYVKLAVNQEAAASAGISLSSQLLRNARLLPAPQPVP